MFTATVGNRFAAIRVAQVKSMLVYVHSIVNIDVLFMLEIASWSAVVAGEMELKAFG